MMRYLDNNGHSAVLANDNLAPGPVSQSVSTFMTAETAAFVRKYASSLQQLISADGLAVGYGSSRSMICVASSGFGAPQVAAELSQDAAAAEALRLGSTVI